MKSVNPRIGPHLPWKEKRGIEGSLLRRWGESLRGYLDSY